MKYTDNELQQEQWRPIDGYGGLYQVSDLGRVRSKKYGRWKVLRPRKTNKGYLTVGLFKDGKKNTVSVHRLVADAFIENENLLNTEINHKDENKENNRVSNLEWCDRSYNLTYNNLHHRRMVNYHRSNYKRNEIKSLYRPDLKIADNLEIFRANGIECCECTVNQLRKDLGLTKQYKPRKKQ